MSRPLTVRLGALAVTAMLATSCTGGSGQPDGPTGQDTPPAPRGDAGATTGTGRSQVTATPPTSTAVPTASPPTDAEPQAVDAYAVSAGHPDAVAAGMDVLAAGGTAVDAAVATAFAVSVVEPFASGVGGGGAALVLPLGEQPLAYDYREVVAADGEIPDSGTGVPGLVAGLERLHQEHGRLPWADLVGPAVALAENGVGTTDLVADQLEAAQERLDPTALEQFFPGGRALEAGDPLVQPELATTLRAVADGGAAAVYADALGGALTQVDGIDARSLADYSVTTPQAPVGTVGPYRVVGAGAPLTGVTVIQMLQMAASLGAGEGSPDTADYIDAVTRAWLRADADLLSEVGDPAFVEVPLEELTDPARNADKVGGAPPPPAGSSGAEGGGNTTHITVVDADGTMVSMTNTVTNFWGSGQEVGGFFLNDQLRRFELGEGGANAPEAGKRSVSYSSPTIVADEDGHPVLGIGSPGGERIPTVLTSIILRWGLHGQTLQEAVDAPRFHTQDGTLWTEPLPEEVVEGLGDLGYSVQEGEPWPYYYGSVQALQVDYEGGEIRGARDDRRAGAFEVATPGR